MFWAYVRRFKIHKYVKYFFKKKFVEETTK